MRMGCMQLCSCMFVILLAAFASIATSAGCSAGQSSTSGILQLKESSCLGGTDKNGLLALCGSAFKVDVNAKGDIYLTPVEQGTFYWAGPGPFQPPSASSPGSNSGDFICREMNATGRYDGSNKQLASVMFYNDVGGPFSRMVVTGANQITLVANHTASYKSPGPNCTYNYTVVSGCVMGISASTPVTCPAGWYSNTGKFGVKYCAPCRPGSSTTKPNSKKCSKCSKGEYNSDYAGQCKKCAGGAFSSKVGATSCDSCSTDAWQYDPNSKPSYVVNPVSGPCATCPPDSWSFGSNPSQCVACSKGVRCCRTNPSADCPACPSGFKSSTTNVTSTFVLDTAQPSSCYKATEAACATAFKVTVMGNCRVVYKPISPLFAGQRSPCFTDSETTSVVSGSKVSAGDFGAFGYYSATANVSTIKPPRVTFQSNVQINGDYTGPFTNCTFTYRATDSSAALLGVPAAPCPAGKPGCILKKSPPTCPKGQYVSNNIDGNTLCLKCPPGTYNPSATSSTCKKCPGGTAAQGYGNTACRKCDIGTYARPGSNTCEACSQFDNQIGAPGFYSSVRGASTCTPCPANSYPQNSDSYPNKVSRCLAYVDGNICCAAGDCSGQTACPASLPPYSEPEGGAILTLKSQQTSDPICKNSDFLRCLKPGSLISSKHTWNPLYLRLKPYQQPGCTTSYIQDLIFSVSTVNRGRTTAYSSDFITPFLYDVVTSKSDRTLTVYFTPATGAPPQLTPATAKCAATFSLTAGAVLDITSPSGTTCPPSTIPITNNGQTKTCRICEAGAIRKGSNCQSCPAGTYQPVDGGSKCLPCAAGTISGESSSSCFTCYFGQVANKAKTTCNSCKQNQYALIGAQQCTACPAGTFAPAGSSACGVPFPKA